MCTFIDRSAMVCDVAIGQVKQELSGKSVTYTVRHGEGTFAEAAADVDPRLFEQAVRTGMSRIQPPTTGKPVEH